MKSSIDVRSRPPASEPLASGDAARREHAETVAHASSASGPVRLLAGGGSAFEQRLLGSTRGDHMPATVRQQLARALNVPSAAAPAGGLRALLRSLRFGKYVPVVGVGAFALLAAWGAQRQPATPPEATQRLVAIAEPRTAETGQPTALAPGSGAAEVEARAPVSAGQASEVAAPAAAVSASVRSRPRVRVRAPVPGAATGTGLREELRALEAVQSSVRAGQMSEARRRLEDYERRFPEGELRLEAELLDLDVLLARGERRQTRERARELLARPEAARYRERLEALLSAADTGARGRAVGSESTSFLHRTSGGH